MRTLKLLVLAAVALLGWAPVASALDSPHDGSFAASVTECQKCHSLHASTGGTLLGAGYTSNNDACLTCHDSAPASPNHFFTGGWSTGREAIPGTGGDQHKWSGNVDNVDRGATAPVNAALLANIVGGTIQCATCHDAHGVRSATESIQAGFASNSVHASLPLNTAVGRVFPVLGSNARMKLMAISGAKPQGYGIKVTQTTPSYQFQISHNYGLGSSKTWLPTPYTFTLGDGPSNDVALDDPAVKIRFLNTSPPPAVGDEWVFYVSYPFLTMSNVSDAMCLDCHRSRHQSYQNVEGIGPLVGTPATPIVMGTTRFSHPVGQPLNANGKSYDLATPLDADGSSADANPSNDIKMVSGVVSCTSCHAPHNADSNSLSVDVR